MPLFFLSASQGQKPPGTKPLGQPRKSLEVPWGHRSVGGLIDQLWRGVNVDSAPKLDQKAANPARKPFKRGGKASGKLLSGRPLDRQPINQRFLNDGVRLSMKAAMPSFWSSVANREWN